MTTGAEIEALLFATPDPIPIKTIAELAGSRKKADEAIAEIRSFWQSRGARLEESRAGLRLVARSDLIAPRSTERQRELSEPALSSLAVIAFDRPVTRQHIEQRRGQRVSASILKTIDPLVSRRERGGSGGGLEYTPSALLLSHLGVSSSDDLPSPDEAMALARSSASDEA